MAPAASGLAVSSFVVAVASGPQEMKRVPFALLRGDPGTFAYLAARSNLYLVYLHLAMRLCKSRGADNAFVLAICDVYNSPWGLKFAVVLERCEENQAFVDLQPAVNIPTQTTAACQRA